MEAEFTLVVDGRDRKPEHVFRRPAPSWRAIGCTGSGTSYHLANGGAVYFDTGVIEVATPVIEIERGCAARAGRSLWEGILEVREALDAGSGAPAATLGWWASAATTTSRSSCRATPRALAHGGEARAAADVHPPGPVMLLAANRRSTGIGVRPRGDRIEITADFTPSPSLMIATGTLITGIVREVMTWPSFELEMLEGNGIPVIADFRPIPHTSRKGWLAHATLPPQPVQARHQRADWETREGTLSLRDIAGQHGHPHFWHPIRRSPTRSPSG
jgi:hypothetical protein